MKNIINVLNEGVLNKLPGTMYGAKEWIVK